MYFALFSTTMYIVVRSATLFPSFLVSVLFRIRDVNHYIVCLVIRIHTYLICIILCFVYHCIKHKEGPGETVTSPSHGETDILTEGVVRNSQSTRFSD